MPTPALTAERGRAPAGADASRGDSGGAEKADSAMIFTRLALAKNGKQAVNIKCRFACGIPPDWQYLCKLTPFTARWFRFNPTRRAKIRLGPMGRSEEHTSALQSLMRISYAVFCLKKKHTNKQEDTH